MDSSDSDEEAYIIKCDIQPLRLSSNTQLLSKACALCKIPTFIKQFNTLKYATGFLCSVVCPSTGKLRGLFTNHHVIKNLEEFDIHFDVGHYDFTIHLNNIRLFFTDKELDVTFIAFKEEFLMELKKCGRLFLKLSEEEHSQSSRVIVLQHPEGREASISEGTLLSYCDKELFHDASTLKGSSGSPILDTDYNVVGIHKGRGRALGRTWSYKEITIHNRGSRIGNVIEAIRNKRRSGVQLFVKMLTGETLPITVSENETIHQLKQKIQEMTDLKPARQSIMIDGKRIHDSELTMSQLNVHENSSVYVFIRYLIGSQVPVRIEDEYFIVELTDDDSVNDLRNVMEKIRGLPLDEYHLFLEREELKDGNLLIKELGLSVNCCFRFVRCFKKLLVPVKMLNDATLWIEVSESDSILDLKQKVQSLTGYSPSKQSVMIHGKRIHENTLTMVQLHVHEKSSMYVFVRHLVGRPVSVRVENRSYMLEMDDDETVDTLRVKTERLSGLSLHRHHLLYRGRHINDRNLALKDLGNPIDSSEFIFIVD